MRSCQSAQSGQLGQAHADRETQNSVMLSHYLSVGQCRSKDKGGEGVVGMRELQ